MTTPAPEPAPRRPAPPAEEARALSKQERIAALAGVLLALMLAALDQTIVATAGPAMQRDLRIPPALYAWITTAYLVASTVMLPIYGKLSDIFGRKPVLLVGVLLFLAGSLLCGIAPNALTLIASRAVQGLGAASLFTSTFAVIADLFPPAERARYMGLIGGVMGVASVVGPLVGGFLTDHFGWHWAFLVNLPVGAVALWFIIVKMPKLGARDRRAAVDVRGAFWLVAGVVPLLVALSLGRARDAVAAGGFAWGSWQILAMFLAAAAGVTAFVLTERRAHDPILHLEIFRHRAIGLGTAAGFVLGTTFLFGVIFLPLFLVNVVGVSATRAGLTMMPLTLGIVASSVTSGQLIARIGRYKQLLLGSLILLAAAFGLMGFTLGPSSTQGDVTLRMILIGLGIGPSLPLYPLIVQNAARPEELGVVTGALTFFRSLGQVVGVALFGTIFASTLTARIGRDVGAITGHLEPEARALLTIASPMARVAGADDGAPVAFDSAQVTARIRQAAGARDDARREALAAVAPMSLAFKRAFAEAISLLYRVGAAIVMLGVALTLFIPELPLRGRVRQQGVTSDV